MSAGEKRPRLLVIGERGSLVRVFKDRRRRRYVVQWGPKARRGQRSFPLTVQGRQEAEAFARAFTAATVARCGTTAELWDRFTAARFPVLRPNSRRLYAEAWRHWTDWFGAARAPESLAKAERGAFRQHLAAKGLGLTTQRGTIRVVRTVYNWAEDEELLETNRWRGFRFDIPTGTAPGPRAEYRAPEFLAIWRELDPAKAGQWRPWAVIGLLGIYGNRQHALLALRWDWVTDDAIHIPAAVEKTGKAATLPLFPLTREILAVCRRWRDAAGADGPHVFFPGAARSRRAHYSIQSLTDALHRAERRAGVPTLPGRAGHGFRRMLVGDLADATGDLAFALQAIGDSFAMAKHYRVKRDDRIRDLLAARIARMVPEGTPEGATESATAPEFEGRDHPSNEG